MRDDANLITDMILAEGRKTITLREGGVPVSLPAATAVLRAMLLSAMKGNSHAQRSLLQLFASAEAQLQKRKEDDLLAAIELQIVLESRRAEYLARGYTDANMPHHPSDVEFDAATGEVRHLLAFTQEELVARAKNVKLRDHLLEQGARSLEAAAEDGDDAILRLSRETALASVRKINELLPSRMRRLPDSEKAPVGPESSPEEVWRTSMVRLASSLFGAGPG